MSFQQWEGFANFAFFLNSGIICPGFFYAAICFAKLFSYFVSNKKRTVWVFLGPPSLNEDLALEKYISFVLEACTLPLEILLLGLGRVHELGGPVP